MKKSLFTKIVSFVCAIAMVIGTLTGVGTITAKAADDIFVDGAVWNYGTVAEYSYHYGWLCGAGSEYQYLIMTYTGDITNLRLQFANGDARTEGYYWVNQEQETHLALVGDPVYTSETGATIVIDLAATGINLDNYDAMDMHYGPGTLNIGYVRLSTSPEVTDVDVMPGENEPNVAEEPMSLDGLVSVWAPEGEGYAYLAGVDVGKSGYKYLQLSYKGDATAFDDLRLEFAGTGKTLGFVNAYDGQLKTVDGTTVPAPTAEEQTVTIDLEASGIDTSLEIATVHLHQTAGNGAFEITAAQLLPGEKEEETESETPSEIVTPEPVDPSTGIQLDDAASGMNKTMHIDQVAADSKDDVKYAYLGFVTFKDLATKDFKYLKFTYTGNIQNFRIEFNNKETNANQGPFWFDPEQEIHFVTADGSEIPMVGNNTTIVIDLEASGVDMSKYNNGIHMHGNSTKDAAFDLTIKDAVLYGGTPTPRETTTAAPQQTTKKATVVTRPGRTKVKSASKKKSAKKIKISLKKLSKAKGYYVQISKAKKFTKKNILVKKYVKKATFTITNKKLKNKKTLYVRAKAYKLNGKKKVLSKKWSVVKKVKIKK